MTFQRLVSNGHRVADIMEYTWPQFLAFAKAVSVIRKESDREFFALTLVATRGDDKAVKRIFEDFGE